MTNTYISFDYELFFGESGTLEHCVLQPTDRLLAIFSETGICATFFVDTLCYAQLIRNAATRRDAARMREQLVVIAGRGHALGLHLHPHWLDAHYVDSRWVFPSYEHYRLDALDQAQVEALFVEGAEMLNSIYRDAGRHDTIDAFRAGGWCVQPFSKLTEGFIKAGIQVDSSVGHGIRGYGPHHRFDFRTAPSADLYRFSASPLKEEPEGRFWELPLTTFRTRPGHKLRRELMRRLHPEVYRMTGDGRGMRYTPSSMTLLKDALTSAPRFLSIDGEPADLLVSTVRQLRHRNVVVMGHTKCFSPSMEMGLRQLAVTEGLRFLAISEANVRMAAAGGAS